MAFCPNCGEQVNENEKFCANCGTPQKTQQLPPAYQQQPRQQSYQPQQAARVTTGVQYDEGICLLLCCCVTPVGALIYYLLTEHPNQY